MRLLAHLAVGGILASVGLASDVHELKKDTFDSFVEDNDLVLAEFFAPWCGHCKALAPEYETAATSLKDKDIPLAKVDCTEETDLCHKYGVEGYPTLKVFRGTENITPYQGQRKADAIISYMTKQSMPAVSTVTKDTLEEFKGADKVVLVGFFAADDKASNDTFTAVAKGLRDNFLFGAIADPAVAKAEGVEQPGLVLYKSFDEGKEVFSKKFTKENMQSFAKVSSVPLVGEVGPESYSDYMAAQIPLAYIFAETAEEREKLAKELKPLAKKHKGVINFATIDAKSFGQHASNLNLEVGKFPAFAIQKTDKNQKFPYDQGKKMTKKDVGKFVDDFVAGKIEPSIKSQPIPETQDGPVTVVVAKNYEEIVIDNDKDVLLEYYAPWCGHCKALAPKYEDLANLYSSPALAKLVTIAKVDATANDVPDEIQGFPTIKLFPAGKKDSPIDYSGSREVGDLAVFIKESGTHKAEGVEPESEEEQLELRSESDKDSDDSEDDMPKQAPAASKVTEKAEKAKDAVKEAKGKATEKAKEAKEKVKEKAKEAKESAKATGDKAKGKAKDKTKSKAKADDDEDHDEL